VDREGTKHDLASIKPRTRKGSLTQEKAITTGGGKTRPDVAPHLDRERGEELE